ncbi:MAG: RluA family pseudouridine synthase, partial [Lachnospiraceae bacterium]|nr:RluA family pseudouridine synthase [Lachnospiraceae bacterium]
SSYKVNENDVIKVLIPDAVPVDIPAENIPLDIVYEDEDILIVNKPKGMVVHPAPGHYTGTLVNALMYHCKDNLSGINGELRPGIVHRIDMDTTGLLVVCKNDAAHNFVADQLKEHSITRKYQAIVYNAFNDDNGTVEGNIGRHPQDRKKMAIVPTGRPAVTHYKVLKNMGKYALVECQLETGRTHQIRVHMTSINHPLLGDEVYGPKTCPFNLQGQVLHAKTLGFVHPRTREYMEFDSDLPDYFQKLIERLEAQ